MKRWIQHWPFVLLCVVSIPWIHPAYVSMWSDWGDASQHMEFVWLVPVLSALLLWLRRKAIVQAVGKPAPFLALPLILLAALFLFLGLRGEQTRFLQCSAVALLMALPLACYGTKMFKVTWFPILLLAFIMPVGFLDNFTVPLRRASVTVTVALLNGLGIDVVQRGTALLSPEFQLEVADPCSGIRSLVALFVGTAAYGAWMLRSAKRRWVLFLSSVPIAFLGNIVRLLLTALTCHFISQDAGMLLHDNALFLVAPLYAITIFYFTDYLKKHDRPASEADMPSGGGFVLSTCNAVILVVIGLAMIGFRVWADQRPPLEFEGNFVRDNFAMIPGCKVTYPWFCQNRQCLHSVEVSNLAEAPAVCPKCGSKMEPMSRAEQDILPEDTLTRKATYEMVDGSDFTVAIVIGGRNRRSIHRPELCLPSQGFTLSERQVLEVFPGVPFASLSLTHEGLPRPVGFGYIFLTQREATVSNLQRVVGDTWERSLHNRIQRWVMITIRSNAHDFQTPEGAEALKRFMAVWYPTLRKTPEEMAQGAVEAAPQEAPETATP